MWARNLRMAESMVLPVNLLLFTIRVTVLFSISSCKTIPPFSRKKENALCFHKGRSDAYLRLRLGCFLPLITLFRTTIRPAIPTRPIPTQVIVVGDISTPVEMLG